MFFLNNPWSSHMYLFSKKPSSSELGLGFSKTLRKEGDSNPRYGYPYDSLANCWFQPLTHPSPRLSVIRHALSEMLFFRKRLQRYYKKCTCANFFRKKCIFGQKKCTWAAFHSLLRIPLGYHSDFPATLVTKLFLDDEY